MKPASVRTLIRWWELMRLPYNGVCLGSVYIAWTFSNDIGGAIDEKPPAYFSDPGVPTQLGLGFFILNVAYSLVYAVEFVVLAREAPSWGKGSRVALLSLGCLLGFFIAGRGAASIADGIATEKRYQLILQLNRQSRFQPLPNNAPEPTTTAVTPRATSPSSK